MGRASEEGLIRNYLQEPQHHPEPEAPVFTAFTVAPREVAALRRLPAAPHSQPTKLRRPEAWRESPGEAPLPSPINTSEEEPGPEGLG